MTLVRTTSAPARHAPVRRQPAQPRRPQLPRLLSGLADGRPAGLLAHERRYGRMPLPEAAWTGDGEATRRAATRLIDVVDRSGLTGRGGAAFPLARKLDSVAAGAGPAVVVANGAEGEPASRKDWLLLSWQPHLVLDGLSLAAFAAGASHAYLALHHADRRLAANVSAAIGARRAAGIDPVPIQLVGIDSGYVASEQTAIVQYINGGPGLPTFAPPRTHERGVNGRPTAVCNVETLAHLALIARYGDAWFRSAGARSAPGTALVTVSGAVVRSGVQEIELGTPIGELIMRAGGPSERPQAVLVGGYCGGWLAAEAAWGVPMSQPALRKVGGAMGAGVLIVLAESSCGLAETARVLRYLAAENASQCGPCVFGLPALADAMADLAYRGGRPDAVDQIARLLPLIEGRGACRHPDGATALAASALATFDHDVRWHAGKGPCFGVSNQPALPVPGLAGRR